MKIGRNEPCPCGSGKKYKKCCLNKEKPPENLLWHRLGDTYDKLQDQLLDYARNTFGDLALPLAMDEFLLWPEEGNPIERTTYSFLSPGFFLNGFMILKMRNLNYLPQVNSLWQRPTLMHMGPVWTGLNRSLLRRLWTSLSVFMKS